VIGKAGEGEKVAGPNRARVGPGKINPKAQGAENRLDQKSFWRRDPKAGPAERQKRGKTAHGKESGNAKDSASCINNKEG